MTAQTRRKSNEGKFSIKYTGFILEMTCANEADVKMFNEIAAIAGKYNATKQASKAIAGSIKDADNGY